jgi:hypothetical protein
MVAMEAVVGKPITSFTHAELDVLINVTNKKHESEVVTARQVLRDVSGRGELIPSIVEN